MDVAFFPVSLILISSESTFLGDLKVTSLVFSILSETLFALNQIFKCFISWMTSLFRFCTDLLYEINLYHKQRDALYSIELPYEDGSCKLKQEVIL